MMKIIINPFTVVITAIIVFICSFVGAAQARTFYYFDTIPGFINTSCEVNPDTPFCGTPETQQGNVSLVINGDDSLAVELDATNTDTTITLTMSGGADEDDVTLTATSADDGIIDDANISFDTQTGLSRTMTIASAEAEGEVDITVKALIGNILEGIEVITVTVSEVPPFICDEDDNGVILDTDDGWEQDGSNNWLIGGDGGDSDIATLQLLCLSQNQTAAVLAADYLLTANVAFDIDFDINKTYDVDGFLTDLSYYVNSNSVDWDGDDNVDTVTDGALSSNGWIPLGNNSSWFSGSFDGGGYTISNLFIDRSANYQGLFGYAKDASIDNVKMSNFCVKGSMFLGGVSGWIRDASINDSSVEGAIIGGSNAGGIVGYAYDGTINNCSSNVYVTGGWTLGALVGVAQWSSVLNESYATGYVGKGNSSTIGGLLARLDGGAKVYNCYASTKVSGTYLVGGLVGLAYDAGNNTIISNSYSNSTVKGNNNIGGVLGGSAINSSSSMNINNSYSLGSVEGTTRVGGTFGGKSSNFSSMTGNVIINNSGLCEYTGESVNDFSVCSSADAITINDNWSTSYWNSLNTSSPTLNNLPN